MREFGKIPVKSDWFIIHVSTEVISGLICFNNLLDTPSCPKLDLDFRLEIILPTKSLFTVEKVKLDKIVCFK